MRRKEYSVRKRTFVCENWNFSFWIIIFLRLNEHRASPSLSLNLNRMLGNTHSLVTLKLELFTSFCVVEKTFYIILILFNIKFLPSFESLVENGKMIGFLLMERVPWAALSLSVEGAVHWPLWGILWRSRLRRKSQLLFAKHHQLNAPERFPLHSCSRSLLLPIRAFTMSIFVEWNFPFSVY